MSKRSGMTYEELVTYIYQNHTKKPIRRIRFEYEAIAMMVDNDSRLLDSLGRPFPTTMYPNDGHTLNVVPTVFRKDFVMVIGEETQADGVVHLLEDTRRVIRRELGDLLPNDLTHFRFTIIEGI